LSGPFTTRWYNDPVLDDAGRETGKTKPVWSIAPESLIVSPAPHETIERSVEQQIWGWAWADGGVEGVHVRLEDEAAWLPAELEPARGREWQRFSTVVLASRAKANNGARQPISGQRNGIYSVPVTVI
jgi:hypothetical protein